MTVSPTIVANLDLTAQQADVASTTLLTAPADTLYRVTAYSVVTQQATTSGQAPIINMTYTDADSGVAQSVLLAQKIVNTNGKICNVLVNTSNLFPYIFKAKSGTDVDIFTNAYLSTGATPLHFALHVVLEQMQ